MVLVIFIYEIAVQCKVQENRSSAQQQFSDVYVNDNHRYPQLKVRAKHFWYLSAVRLYALGLAKFFCRRGRYVNSISSQLGPCSMKMFLLEWSLPVLSFNVLSFQTTFYPIYIPFTIQLICINWVVCWLCHGLRMPWMITS